MASTARASNADAASEGGESFFDIVGELFAAALRGFAGENEAAPNRDEERRGSGSASDLDRLGAALADDIQVSIAPSVPRTEARSPRPATAAEPVLEYRGGAGLGSAGTTGAQTAARGNENGMLGSLADPLNAIVQAIGNYAGSQSQSTDHRHIRGAELAEPHISLAVVSTISYVAPVVQSLERVELWGGWFGFEAATRPFSIIGIHVFIPFLISGLAAQQKMSSILGLEGGVSLCEGKNREDCLQCLPGLGYSYLQAEQTNNIEENPNSSLITETESISIDMSELIFPGTNFIQTCILVSAIFQAFVALLLIPFADHGHWRRRFMYLSSFGGGLVACMFVFVRDPGLYWVGGVLLIICSVLHSLGRISYDSYLPILTDCSQDVIEAMQGDSRGKLDVREKKMHEHSASGTSTGYAAATALAVSFWLVARNDTAPLDAELLSWLMLCIGVWWAVTGVLSTYALDSREGPALPETRNVILWPLSSMWSLCRNVKDHWQAFVYLVFKCLFADGHTVVYAVPSLFLFNYFCLDMDAMLKSFLIVQASATAGPMLFNYMDRLTEMDSKYILLINVMGYLCFLLWIQLSWITRPMVSDSYAGLEFSHFEAAVILAAWGAMMGSVQAYSRAVYLQFAPKFSEAHFYSMYHIADLVSAAISFTCVAALTRNGYYGIAMFYIITLVVVSGIFLLLASRYMQPRPM